MVESKGVNFAIAGKENAALFPVSREEKKSSVGYLRNWKANFVKEVKKIQRWLGKNLKC